MTLNERILSARSLLNKFLELWGDERNFASWKEELLSYNSPSQYRLKQLMALFRAFEISFDPQLFRQGKFIQTQNPLYEDLLKTIDEKLLEIISADLSDTSVNPSESVSKYFWASKEDLPKCFKILLEYRLKVEDLLIFSKGVILSTGCYFYANLKAKELNQIVRDNIAIIDDILVALIDPEAKEYSMEQLVRNYDYPDVDLRKIDIEWM